MRDQRDFLFPYAPVDPFRSDKIRLINNFFIRELSLKTEVDSLFVAVFNIEYINIL